jgi:hypothetical protein
MPPEKLAVECIECRKVKKLREEVGKKKQLSNSVSRVWRGSQTTDSKRRRRRANRSNFYTLLLCAETKGLRKEVEGQEVKTREALNEKIRRAKLDLSLSIDM